ncbi:MAG: glycoside hydrolase family 38 C-terminal domain-containing protein [Gemmatimonadota bacterium]|jgi:alpha-mannosidase
MKRSAASVLGVLGVLLLARPGTAQTDRAIPEWLVVGTWRVVDGQARVRHPYLLGEADAAPAPGERTDGRRWTRARTDTANLGRLDLLPVLEGVSPVADAAAYAFTWITSPEDRTVTLAFESDDDLRVWLNGLKVVDHEVARGVGSGTDTVTVRLSEGANRLLLKVVNRSGGFGLGGRVLGEGPDPVHDLGLSTERPPSARVASVPAPAVTLSPPAWAAGAVLEAEEGTLRVPVEVRASRWGGLTGEVTVAVGGRSATLPPGSDGEPVAVEIPTTWRELAAAAEDDGGVSARADGERWNRPLDAGAVLATLGRPLEVHGWRWREAAGAWEPLPERPEDDAYGVDPALRRRVAELGFRTTVPAPLGGLTLEMDAAELPPGTVFTVNGTAAPRDAAGRVELCGPCAAGNGLTVTVAPSGDRWWDPPRLVVPDPGWLEVEQGVRWARFFRGADAVEAPDPSVARELLASSVGPGKERYHAVVGNWLRRLEPMARDIGSDTVDLVGNSHIDAAWLWRWPETVDVVRNTWRSAAKLLAKYPEATFAGSGAQYYEWLEAYEPALLARIQELVREGRWAPVGGWWVEPDVNMPSGESLVRQALYGQRTFQRLFGTTSRVAWIPDTFGYPWTLPQIFRDAGFDWFVTQKLRWNDTDAWTADRNLFWWRGRDGSRILTYIPYGYSHHLEEDRLGAQWMASRDSTAGGRMLVLYGVGDHGGGPTLEMMDRRRALARVPTYPALEGKLPERALERMEKAGGASAPVIDDELYLEYHRGVFTSQAAAKAWNRRLENLVTTAEALSAHAATLDPGDAWYNYPRGSLTEAWKATLFNQFHDVLPGSGIGPVYEDAVTAWREAEHLLESPVRRAGERIASQLDTRPPLEGARPWIVLNPSGRARTGEVEVEWSGSGARVVDGNGEELPATVRGGRLRFRVADVPATGGTVVFVVGEDGGRVAEGEVAGRDGTGPAVLENEALRVEIDPLSGELSRVLDRVAGREVLLPGGGGNRLATTVDEPLQWDAWNIDSVEGPWTPAADTVEVGPVTEDALGVRVRVLRADAHGRYDQVLSLPRGARRLEVETTAEWRTEHRLLKAFFPLAVRADSVWAEIPYGAIGRPATPTTSKDSARYEVPMQRWIDASAGEWGVSLVNDSKYGYDVRADTLRLTLLKAPTWPDSTADRGTHRFTYWLVPHDGDWRSGATEAAAEALNRPLRAVAVDAHEGEGRARGFLGVDGADLGALKVAEEGEDLVVRVVERHGRRSAAELELPWPFEWREADLLERPRGEWSPSDGERAELTLEPWEIRTLRVRRR